jgi:hypothetical protein
MTKKKFWQVAYAVGFYGWALTLLVMLLGATFEDDGLDPPLVFFILWVGLPIIWMICSGFILNDMYGYHLGWRREHYGPNNEYVRDVDTTPAKRIILQWLAPFTAAYFWLSGKERYKDLSST